MSLLASRALVRRSQVLLRGPVNRGNSTSTTAKATEAASSAASKASSIASSATSKASEGLSRVSSSAGPAISGAAKGLGDALGRIGGRTGRIIAFVEASIPPIIYYSRVGIELSKLVFRGQNMSPPSLATFQSYLQQFIQIARHPASILSSAAGSSTPGGILGQIRNINKQQAVTAGVITAEVIGFFTVGEMLGRLKIVGYRGETGGHH